VVRRILLRTVLFIAPGAVLWALLPLVARQVLGLEAGAYGALFGALGVGAVVAALVLGRVREHLSTNRLLAAVGGLFAVVLVVIVLVPSFVVGRLLLVFAGLAWTAVVSTLNAELQIFLPVWVRGRALAMYVVFVAGAASSDDGELCGAGVDLLDFITAQRDLGGRDVLADSFDRTLNSGDPLEERSDPRDTCC
jgi:predicted MFS family arabinose efflux permease